MITWKITSPWCACQGEGFSLIHFPPPLIILKNCMKFGSQTVLSIIPLLRREGREVATPSITVLERWRVREGSELPVNLVASSGTGLSRLPLPASQPRVPICHACNPSAAGGELCVWSSSHYSHLFFQLQQHSCILQFLPYLLIIVYTFSTLAPATFISLVVSERCQPPLTSFAALATLNLTPVKHETGFLGKTPLFPQD